MKAIREHIIRWFPQQRRRRWKYVSPVRRRVGLGILAFLLVLIYFGWYFTRDSNVRREAKNALEDLTGADVHIDRAHFSLFEGIRLYGVRVTLPDERSPYPFFTAGEVVIKHRPTELLRRGRLKITEIVCMQPVVTVEYDTAGGMSNAERLFRLAVEHNRKKPADNSGPMQFPRIFLRDGYLKSLVKSGDTTQRTFEEGMSCELRPTGKDQVMVTVESEHEDGQKIQWAKIELNTASGQIASMSGSASHRLFRLLPPQYHKWIQQYDPQGDFSVVEGEGTDPQEGRFEIKLDDFSFNLPDGDKVFAVKNVTGKLFFRKEGIEFKDVTGRPTLLGTDTNITINGHCHGYSAQSAFDLMVKVRYLQLPQASLPGRLADICRVINRDYQPRGTADMTMHVVRDKDGDLQVAGVIQPRKLRTICRFFPLETQTSGGSLTFTNKSIEDINLELYRGQSKFAVRGNAQHITGMDWDYEVKIDATDVKFDDALRNALPEQAQKTYDSLSPTGKCNGKVLAWEKGDDRGIKVDLRMNGFASICYDGFPYRLDNLSGEVNIENGNVSVPWAQSEKGDMVVAMKGDFNNSGQADMSITARNLPLNKKLFAALPEDAAKTVEKLSLSGSAEKVACRVVRDKGKTNFNVAMNVKDVAWKYDEWPYAVEGASGDIIVTPDTVTLKGVQGHHGMGRITLDGDIKYGVGKKLACNLLIQGAAVMFDKDFASALPEQMQKRCEEFSLGGLADFRVKIISDGSDAPVDFNVAIDASSMEVCYKKIPIPLSQVSGSILIKPGRLELNNVQGISGQGDDIMSLAASGYIEDGPKGVQANLAVNLVNVDLDKTLMDSLSPEAGNFLKRFKPGGKFSGKIKQFYYSKPAGKPAQWKLAGGFAFKDMEMDFGFGWRKLTGTWAGWLWREEKGMGMQAECKVDRLRWDKYAASKLSGDLTMQPGSDLILISKLVGRSMGGKIAGKASLDIGTPLKYSMNLAMEDIDLAELFKSADGETPKDVTGKLRGEIEFSMIAGDKPMKQATGELEIYKASMYKMPVILGMLNVIYLTVPGDGTFNSGVVKYHLRNEKLRLEEIFLTGTTLSVIGSGDLNLADDTLSLTFLTGPPGKMPRLNELAADLLSAISQELVEIRVSGTLKKPKMETVTLRSLETIIKRLIGPAAQQN